MIISMFIETALEIYKFNKNENKYQQNLYITGSKKNWNIRCVSAYESVYFHIKRETEAIVFGFGNK